MNAQNSLNFEKKKTKYACLKNPEFLKGQTESKLQRLQKHLGISYRNTSFLSIMENDSVSFSEVLLMNPCFLFGRGK